MVHFAIARFLLGQVLKRRGFTLAERQVVSRGSGRVIQEIADQLGIDLATATEDELVEVAESADEATLREIIMASRDPQTGQFVSSDGAAGLPGWSGLEHQLDYVEMRTTTDLDFTNTGEPDMTFEDLTRFEPIGGLGRGELAELVAYRWESLMTSRTSNAGTVPGDAHAYYEVSLDPIIQASRFDIEGNIQYDEERVVDADGDGTDDFFVRTGPSIVDPDVIMTAEAQHHPAAEDATAGSGWGGHSTYHSEFVNLRRQLGGGPVLDRHNTVYVHGSLGGHGSVVQASQLRLHLFWQVFEE